MRTYVRFVTRARGGDSTMWRFEIGRDEGGQPRWWLYDSYGSRRAVSGEGFDSVSDARRAAATFREHAWSWDYETFRDSARRPCWRAWGANRRRVASSGRAFPSLGEAEN